MTFLIFFAILVLLILSHEFGHFLVAKKTNTKVEEFGFGFPPKILGWKKGETTYSFNLFPIGGFVKILGENYDDDIPENEKEKSFYFKSASIKAFIVGAGVLFNLLLAWTLISASLGMGIKQQIKDDVDLKNINANIVEITVVDVEKDSPADKAGLKQGDVLLSLSSENNLVHVLKINDVQNFLNSHRGREIELTYKRNNSTASLKAKPRDVEAKDGALGIAMVRLATVKENWHSVVFKGLKQTVLYTTETAYAIFYFLVGLFKGTGFDQVAGPVGIFNIVDEAAKFGLSYILQLSALLSINLAVINFLPFPALDGGRLLFIAIEKIKGAPINPKIANTINSIGFALLLFLMIIITYKDITRII